jgi:hypothetical protein
MENLSQLEKEMCEIASSWNGKDSGRAEDRANTASDIIEKIEEIRILLAELDEF